MMRRPDMPAVAAMLADRIAELVHDLVAEEPTGRTGGALRFRAKGSLVVFVAGARRGTWFDHDPPAGGRPAGPRGAAGGDALDLVAHLRACDRRAAWDWALAWLGLDRGTDQPARRPAPSAPRPAAAQRMRPEADTLDLARRLWCEASAPDASGSLVPLYLEARGLRLEEEAPLRFHPACPRGAERWPAMLALMTDPVTGAPCGVHRTFLARDGRGKAPVHSDNQDGCERQSG